MILITLEKIRAKSPCTNGWEKLLASKNKTKADDVEFPLSDVIDSNGLNDTFWCLRCLPEHDNLWRLFAVWCAEQVKHLMTDERSLNALVVASNHANGLATDDELATAAAAAAAWAADAAAARAAAAAAAWAADAAAAWAADAAAARAWDAQTEKLRQILTSGKWVT